MGRKKRGRPKAGAGSGRLSALSASFLFGEPLDPATAERIRHLSKVLVNRLLHEPTVRLRERAGAGDGDAVAEAIRELFGIAAPREP